MTGAHLKVALTSKNFKSTSVRGCILSLGILTFAGSFYTITLKRQEAVEARDALCKALYSR